MRIRTLCAVTLTGPVIPPRTEVAVPAGFEARAQRLIDHGSAELLVDATHTQPSAESADGLSGDAAGADSSAPAAEPISTPDAQNVSPEGSETAHTGGAKPKAKAKPKAASKTA